jgi:hypothetical protein
MNGVMLGGYYELNLPGENGILWACKVSEVECHHGAKASNCLDPTWTLCALFVGLIPS